MQPMQHFVLLCGKQRPDKRGPKTSSGSRYEARAENRRKRGSPVTHELLQHAVQS